MRRVVVSNWISVDGFICGPKRELDWFAQAGFLGKTEYAEYTRDLLSEAGGILLGHATYDQFVRIWPTLALSDPSIDPSITERMNGLPKMVFSKTLDEVSWGAWGNARLIRGDAGDEVRRLKKEPGKDLVILGSGTLVSSLTNLRLIDEYQLIVQPIILGAGIPEFQNQGKRTDLKLVKSRPLREGAVILYFQLAE
jgi:dihydrofolate reductase